MPEVKPVISGELKIEDGPPFSDAIAHIYLEDVSRADAASKIVSQQDIPHVSYAGGSTNIKFTMAGRQLDERARYIVRAHIDIKADGKINAGDYLTMESYPVLTHGHGAFVSMRLRRIT